MVILDCVKVRWIQILTLSPVTIVYCLCRNGTSLVRKTDSIWHIIITLKIVKSCQVCYYTESIINSFFVFIVEHVPSSCLVVYISTTVPSGALAHWCADRPSRAVCFSAAISLIYYWIITNPRTLVTHYAVACIWRNHLWWCVCEISKIRGYIIPRWWWGAVCVRQTSLIGIVIFVHYKAHGTSLIW